MDGNALQVVEGIKLLGVTLDTYLNWNEHVNRFTKSASYQF